MTDLPLPTNSYCAAARGHPWHGPYHDHEYGFPVREDDALFGRLILEINQAGLSWLTILKKRDAFRRAYDNPKAEWVKLFRRTFRFTGGEITGEFLVSTGYLSGAHAETCPVHHRAVAAGAPWART